MHSLTLTILTSLLTFGITSQNPCFASEEFGNPEPTKKHQKLIHPSFSLETSSIQLDQENHLPDEIWIHIFDHLSFRDLGNIQQVCNHWHRLGRDDNFSLPLQILKKSLSGDHSKLGGH